MLELIILAFVLFIGGVAATIVYDKHKEIKSKRAELYASRPATPAPTPRTRKPKATPFEDAGKSVKAKSLDAMIQDVKSRAKAGEKTLKVQNGMGQAQTMTVQELIKKLEQMKKEL